MKFGLLTDFSRITCNYGDYAQTIAIENIYIQMGIPEEDIVPISVKQLSEYDGEPLLLPYSYILHYLMDELSGTVDVSDKIIFVFLGVSLVVNMQLGAYPPETLLDPQKKWLALLRKFAPIGCRDAFTMEFLKKAGIPSYLQGCITNSLPCRPAGDYQEILLVECPKEFLSRIPPELLKAAKTMKNAGYKASQTMGENYRKAKAQYLYYRDHAKLLITSRYHVATPCNAMGVPTVFVKRSFFESAEDIRLDTLNPNIQLCSAENHSPIDWDPVWADFSELKESITALAIARIKEAYLRYTKEKQIRKFYRSRIEQYPSLNSNSENNCFQRLRRFVSTCHPSSAGKFYIWGALPFICRDAAVPLVQYVTEINPKLEFAGWLDSFKEGTLARKKIYHPDDLHLAENDFIIVVPVTAAASAREYVRREQLGETQFFSFASEMVEEDDLASFCQ